MEEYWNIEAGWRWPDEIKVDKGNRFEIEIYSRGTIDVIEARLRINWKNKKSWKFNQN